MTFDYSQLPTLILFGIGILSPVATELLTKYDAPRWLKSGINFGLAAVGSAVTTVVFDPDASLTRWLIQVGGTVVLSVATHYTGVTAPVQNKTKNVGFVGGARNDTPMGAHALDDVSGQPE